MSGLDVAQNGHNFNKAAKQTQPVLHIVVRGELARLVLLRIEQPIVQYFAARTVSFRSPFFVGHLL